MPNIRRKLGVYRNKILAWDPKTLFPVFCRNIRCGTIYTPFCEANFFFDLFAGWMISIIYLFWQSSDSMLLVQISIYREQFSWIYRPRRMYAKNNLYTVNCNIFVRNLPRWVPAKMRRRISLLIVIFRSYLYCGRKIIHSTGAFFQRLLANWKCPNSRRFWISHHQVIANLP